MYLRSILLSLLEVTLFCGCAFGWASGGSIFVGMTHAEILRQLKHSGAVEVAKDITPAAKGWAVAGRDECLFLSFKHGVLTGITVEERAGQPKIYRRWHDAKTYDL